MNELKLFCCLLLLSFTGCAANQGLYETPLRESGILGDGRSPSSGWRLEEISASDLASMKPGERPAMDTDEAGIWMVMDQAEEKLKTSGRLVRDEELAAYLQGIACRLTPEYCGDIRIYVVRVPYFNASMASNGAMQVWTGLLLRVRNEAQLAAVLGHEIGHYLRRHALQQMRDMESKSNMLVFVRFASAMAGVGVAGDVASLVAAGGVQAFGRDMEREADGYGLAMQSRAGYDPREVAKIWERLMEEEKAGDDDRQLPTFLASHPTQEERFQAIRGLGERIQARSGQGELGKERFDQIIVPRRAEYLQDELSLRTFARSEKLFEMMLEDDPKPGELHFYKGEVYRLRGEEGDLKLALAEYEEAAKSSSGLPPEMYRSMGLLYCKTGDNRQAAAALGRYLEACPGCPDTQMVKHMIEGFGQ